MKTVALAPPLGDAAAGTRDRLAQLLLQEGPSTAAALAARLALTPTAIRRHLDGMLADGILVARCPEPATWSTRGRGRPARVYALSASGHAKAPHAYDALANEALDFLAASGQVETFAEGRAAAMATRYRDAVAPALAAGSGTSALAEALTRDGYAATTHDVGSGATICQHHCPVADVAARFPQLCEAETEAIGALLGQHVQRLATIAHGDGVCTTHVPRRETAAAALPDDRSTRTTHRKKA